MTMRDHVKKAAIKAENLAKELGRIILNIGGPRVAKKPQMMVIHLIILDAAAIWHKVLKY